MENPKTNFILLVFVVTFLTQPGNVGARSNSKSARLYERCVVGRLSISQFFNDEDHALMTKIVKETEDRMNKLRLDPNSATNMRTMLRLFAAAMANLMQEGDAQKFLEKKHDYLATLKRCSEYITESVGIELVGEVTRIFMAMEKERFPGEDSNAQSSSLPKENKASESGCSKAGKRSKRSPQAGMFDSNFGPSLEAIIAGVLISSPDFSGTFSAGLSRRDAVRYVRDMVQAGLETYSPLVINQAINAASNAILRLSFMSGSADYAFAISKSLNSVLQARNVAFFSDGLVIGNGMVAELRKILRPSNPVSPFSAGSDSISSSSAWGPGSAMTSSLTGAATLKNTI